MATADGLSKGQQKSAKVSIFPNRPLEMPIVVHHHSYSFIVIYRQKSSGNRHDRTTFRRSRRPAQMRRSGRLTHGASIVTILAARPVRPGFPPNPDKIQNFTD